jgi:hypothetical protein
MATTRLRLPLQGNPCGQVRYHDQAQARAACERLEAANRKAGRYRTARPLRTYCCPRCQAFHVGHGVG